MIIMDKLLATMAAVVILANIAIAIPALATDDANAQASTELHKDYLAANSNSDSQDDDADYYASKQHLVIKDANNRLRKIKQGSK